MKEVGTLPEEDQVKWLRPFQNQKKEFPVERCWSLLKPEEESQVKMVGTLPEEDFQATKWLELFQKQKFNGVGTLPEEEVPGTKWLGLFQKKKF